MAAQGPSAADIAIVKASVTSAQVGVQSAREGLADYVLRAPSAGTVATVTGRTATTSPVAARPPARRRPRARPPARAPAPASSGFISLTDLTKLQVKAGFSETDAAKIRLGQTATVTLAALSNEKLAAHVIAIDTNVDDGQQRRHLLRDVRARQRHDGRQARDDRERRGRDRGARTVSSSVPSSAVSALGATSTVTVLNGEDQVRTSGRHRDQG